MISSLLHCINPSAAIALRKYDEAFSTLQNKQHQGPAANQALMPASSVYSLGGQGIPKDVQSLDKY